MPREYKPSCECGKCEKCKSRERMRKKRASATPEELDVMRAKSAECNRRARRSDPLKYRVEARVRYRLNKELIKAHVRNSMARQPEKQWARIEAYKALKRGEITRQPCGVCGADDYVEMHHEDYSKPLEVRWLCGVHHADADVEQRKRAEQKEISDAST